ncbi:MAG: SMC-Scp complex subunit ScpB [Actinomycetota bacterium]|nr:SMC-Scp complex subunit ScpB [Actinomycetota bacterium]
MEEEIEREELDIRCSSSEVEKIALIEALILVSPQPIKISELSEMTGIEPGAVREIVNELMEVYRKRAGGIVLREVAEGFGLYAIPEAAPYISRMIRSRVNPRLTKAALETVAIVAYLQPVSRGMIAEIRGVQSDGVIRTLEERGLIEPVGRGEPPGYPMLYGTTLKFLEKFGLKSLDELPSLKDFEPDEGFIERIRTGLSWELPQVTEIGEAENKSSNKYSRRMELLQEEKQKNLRS